MNKFSKYFLSGIFLLVMLLSMWFVIAAPAILPQLFSVNESVQYKYNISVNNTDIGATANITQVNITIPINFTFTVDTNGTDTIFETFANTSTATNTTLVWTNSTVFLINGSSDGSGEKKYFWFNATATPGLYNITVTTLNATATYPWKIPVLVNDTTYPLISYGEGTESNNANKSQNWVYVNASVIEAFPYLISFLIYNSTGEVNQTNYTMADQTSNTTINWTGLVEGMYSYNVSIVDTQGNENNSIGSRNITLDTTDPAAGASCSPSSVTAGAPFPCTCSGTDSGATASGVSTTSGSSTSSDGTSTPTSTGTFTYTCTVTDYAGNSASATTTYTVQDRGSSAVTTSSLPKKINSWTQITPGVPVIMKDFDSEIGIKQIQIEVHSETQDVKITVTKYSAKPAEVSVAKTGEIYQYLHINAENFGEDLEQATVEFRAERTWAAGVELGKNDIAVSRYNEAANKWDELTTTSTEEDAIYYYYEVELDEFSYFAISEKAVVGEGEPSAEEEGGISVWVWILIAVVIIAIIAWQMKTKKK